MYQFVKRVCAKLCHNYFENSEKSCISNINIQDKLSFLLRPSTLLEVKITRKIQAFCQINRNRFWTIYYRITQSKIYLSCKRCNKINSCQEYILNRIIKYIKAFDIEQESVVFREVRKSLTNSDNFIKVDKNTQEVINHYTQKITKKYNQKPFDFDTGFAIVENVLIDSSEDSSPIKKRLERYRAYKASIILHDLISESFNGNKSKSSKFRLPLLLELFNKEKFLNYIKAPIESRFKDFVKSRHYLAEIVGDIENPEEITENSEGVEEILATLDSESQIIYKLKFGIRLDNREFLTLTYRMNYLDRGLIEQLTPEEKLYIKFSLHFKIDDDSKHLSMLDVKEIKKSISKKISDYRKKLKSQSYIETDEEIFVKLIYSEPLSAKEIGAILSFTDKQIGKKVESIKKRLKKLEYEL